MNRPMKLPEAAWIRLIFLAGCVFTLTACRSLPPAAPPSATLRIAAAADLDPVLRGIAADFERRSGVSVTLNFGSSGLLSRQIEQGAPVDVFLSANKTFVERLDRAGLVAPGSIRTYARGRIVVWQPATAPFAVASVRDLADARISRIAIANPEHAPYGVAAEQAVRNAGIESAVRPKFVFGENVSQALQLAVSGNAEAAIVAASLANARPGKVLPIPPELYAPLDQALCVLKRSEQSDAARRFTEFIVTDGRTVLQANGFDAPEK